jgi:hypothetical protein
VKRRDLERHLREHGARLLREGGRHSYWGFDPERSTAAAHPQWKAGHLHDAVLAASKAVNALLESKVGRSDVSEVKLVTDSFSAKEPVGGAPRLRFPDIDGEQTRESVTAGVLSFGVGCFKAIRNPLGHLPDDQHDITEQEALEQLAAWSLFARWIDRATISTEP